jgi:hypothetical protein
LRLRIEHSIDKLKFFKISSERCGYPKPAYAAVFAIVAGIIIPAAAF